MIFIMIKYSTTLSHGLKLSGNNPFRFSLSLKV